VGKPEGKKALGRSRRRWDNIVIGKAFPGNKSVQHTTPWRWIPGDRLGTERVSVSTNIQQTLFRVNEHPTNAFPCQTKIQQRVPRIRTSNQHFPWLPLDYISGRVERNSFIRHSFLSESSFVN
jgi:hypothetical protein